MFFDRLALSLGAVVNDAKMVVKSHSILSRKVYRP